MCLKNAECCRRTVKELFLHADKDGSQVLSKEEFGELVTKALKDKSLPKLLTHECVFT